MPGILNASIPNIPFIPNVDSLHALSEPLYDVVNESGEVMIRGIAHVGAVKAIEANQSLLPVRHGWDGDMCIRLQRSLRRGMKGGAV